LLLEIRCLLARSEALTGVNSERAYFFHQSFSRYCGAETLTAWKVAQPLTTPANAPVATSLAREMKSFEALKGFGFSLEGDLQEATGNTTAAEAAYTQAAKVRPSPSLSRRMQKLQVKGRVPPG